jgi:hypothetical protein
MDARRAGASSTAVLSVATGAAGQGSCLEVHLVSENATGIDVVQRLGAATSSADAQAVRRPDTSGERAPLAIQGHSAREEAHSSALACAGPDI